MLYVVQHGEAVPKDQDPDRPLTETGAEDAVNTAAFLARSRVSVDEVRHSGKLRAEQTAGILGGHLTPERDTEAVDGLGATDDPAPVVDAATGWERDVMLVSHMPFVARLVAALVGADVQRPPVAFVPGTVVALEHDAEAGWRIAWMVRPGLLH